MDDVIDDMGYDGKHSYEDNICRWKRPTNAMHRRIAILGGIDVDFICRATPEGSAHAAGPCCNAPRAAAVRPGHRQQRARLYAG